MTLAPNPILDTQARTLTRVVLSQVLRYERAIEQHGEVLDAEYCLLSGRNSLLLMYTVRQAALSPYVGVTISGSFRQASSEVEDIGFAYISLDIYLSEDGWDYTELHRELRTSLRHELEHARQRARSPTAFHGYRSLPARRESISLEDVHAYMTQPVEVEAWVASLYLQAKKTRQPLIDVLRWRLQLYKLNLLELFASQPHNLRYIDTAISDILQRWIIYARRRYPMAVLSS